MEKNKSADKPSQFLKGLITPNRKFLREVACWGFDNKHLQVSKMGLCF